LTDLNKKIVVVAAVVAVVVAVEAIRKL